MDNGELHPVCGMQSPEDIAVVPGGDYLLLSELGGIGERPAVFCCLASTMRAGARFIPVPVLPQPPRRYPRVMPAARSPR